MASASGSEAVNEDGDPLREARAYSQSVLFMIAVPYLVLAGLVVYLVRCCRAANRRSADILSTLHPPRTDTPLTT